jgi:hypothetical protein
MAVGKSGMFELAGTNSITVRVFWSEEYTVASNQSVVSIDKLQVKSSSYSYVAYFPNGSISVNGAKVIEFNSVLGTHNADMMDKNTYVDVKGGGSYQNAPWKSGSITHNSDGSKTVAIAVDITGATISGNMGHGWRVSGSQAVALTTIPRASTITSASNVTLGNACTIKWTPKSAAFYYKMGFQIGDWKHSTEVVHPNKTTEYTYTGLTIPLEVANQIPNNPSGTMYVYLHTFSDSAGTAQIGDTASTTFTVTVPDVKETKPVVSMGLTPVHSLPSKFSSLYIQGKSKVKGTLSAEGKYKAGIASGGISMAVGDKSYGSEDGYTSDYLSNYGTIKVTGYATDSRGYTGENQKEIEVIAYQNPKLESVSAVRCDKNGNASESGTYLKISAKASHTPVNGLNICKIQYCYSKSGGTYTQWATISESTQGTADVTTSPLLGSLSTQASYMVQIRAVDEIGIAAESNIAVATEKVYWHRDGARNALGLGKYNEKDNALDSGWDIYMNSHKVTGLPTPTGSTDAVPLGFLKDYVLEQGTSGIWAYRKWNSGFAELWCSLTATYQNGNVLASEEVAYPFTMTNAISAVGSLNSYGGNAASALPWNVKLAYGPAACRMWVHNSGGGFATAITVEGSAYIVGRWK